MSRADKFAEGEIVRIAESLLARSTYVKCPVIDANGQPTNAFNRTLYIAFDPRDKQKAAKEANAISMFIEFNKPHRYAHQSENLRPFLSDEQIEDLRLKNPDYDFMSAQEISATESFKAPDFMGDTPPLLTKYFITLDPDDFEHQYLQKIGHIIEPSLEELHHELRKQQNLQREMLEYFQGMAYHDPLSGQYFISEIIADQLYEKEYDLHLRWDDFMFGGDVLDDAKREALGLSKDAEMVAIINPHEVVNNLHRSRQMEEAVKKAEMGLDCPYTHRVGMGLGI